MVEPFAGAAKAGGDKVAAIVTSAAVRLARIRLRPPRALNIIGDANFATNLLCPFRVTFYLKPVAVDDDAVTGFR